MSSLLAPLPNLNVRTASIGVRPHPYCTVPNGLCASCFEQEAQELSRIFNFNAPAGLDASYLVRYFHADGMSFEQADAMRLRVLAICHNRGLQLIRDQGVYAEPTDAQLDSDAGWAVSQPEPKVGLGHVVRTVAEALVGFSLDAIAFCVLLAVALVIRCGRLAAESDWRFLLSVLGKAVLMVVFLGACWIACVGFILLGVN